MARQPQILLATDFSEGSARAAEIALAYARRMGARLHVLHVTRQGWEEEMRGALSHWASRFEGVPVTLAVENGAAAENISRYAERNAADLVVLGTHGRTGLARALLGSVAETVSRSAPCPVMTVPPDLHDPRLHAPEASATPAARLSAPRACLVCHGSAEELICGTCRARIQGEALERKWDDERKVRI